MVCRNFCFWFLFLSFAVVFVIVAECKKSTKLPEDIKLCNKKDPRLNECLKNLIESLRPTMMKGIPEIDLPPLDPLILKEVVVLPGDHGQMRAIGHNIKITGISNFKLNHIKANVEKLEIDISVFFPFVRYEGTYDVDARFANLKVKGTGPMSGNVNMTHEFFSDAGISPPHAPHPSTNLNISINI